MADTWRKFYPEFREGAAGRAEDREIDRAGRAGVGVNEGTLGNWVGRDRRARGSPATVW